VLKDFDKAFTNKVKTWFSNTIYANTALVYNIAYNLIADPKTVLKFPLISIYRPSGFEMSPVQTFSARKTGVEYYRNEDGDIGMARFLMVKLPYQIDIYSKTPEALYDITEEIMQAFNFEPKLYVIQEDSSTGNTYEESYDILYESGPSEMSEFDNDDRVYHYSLVYTVGSARLVNFRGAKAVEEVVVDETIEEE
jgi:hypothetical protein